MEIAMRKLTFIQETLFPCSNVPCHFEWEELEPPKHKVTWDVRRHHRDAYDMLSRRSMAFDEWINILKFIGPVSKSIEIKYLGLYDVPEAIAEVVFQTEPSETYDDPATMDMCYNADVEYVSRAPKFRERVYTNLDEFANVIMSPDTWGCHIREARIAIIRDWNSQGYHLVKVVAHCHHRWEWILWPNAH